MSIPISLLARALDLFSNILKLECDALRDLVPLEQLKRHEKDPRRNVTFSKVAGFSLQLY